jgi:hypothetical protein
MLNDCWTLGAALKLTFPGCDAVIVQLPAPVIVTVSPDTEQLPVAPNPTGRPDDAVAVTAKGGSLVVLFGSAVNVMIWLACAMPNVCGTLIAAR